MTDFPTVPITEKAADRINFGSPEDRIVLRVDPPLDGGGLEPSNAFLETLHRKKSEDTTFGTRNTSNVCSMEIWYENEEINFYFTVPDEEEENHHRRQLSGQFLGASITKMRNPKEKIVEVKEGQYMAATMLSLRNHYFEPIGNSIKRDDQSANTDPYQPILNEMDTKETSTTSMIQFLYKPALEKWTQTPVSNMEDYAENVSEEGVSDPKLFGLLSSKIDDSSTRSSIASAIRERASSQAFHTDVRIAVIHETREGASRELSNLVDLFKTVYREKNGQKFVPRKGVGPAETVHQMVKRESDRLKLPNNVLGWLKYNFRRNTDYIPLTVSELASIAHIPSSSDVNVDGISWTDDPVQGTLDSSARKFVPVTEEEKEKAGPYAGTPKMHNPTFRSDKE